MRSVFMRSIFSSGGYCKVSTPLYEVPLPPSQFTKSSNNGNRNFEMGTKKSGLIATLRMDTCFTLCGLNGNDFSLLLQRFPSNKVVVVALICRICVYPR